MSVHFGQLDKRTIVYKAHSEKLHLPVRQASAQTVPERSLRHPLHGLSKPLSGNISTEFDDKQTYNYIRVGERAGPSDRRPLGAGGEKLTTVEIKGENRDIFGAVSPKSGLVPQVSVSIGSRAGQWHYFERANKLGENETLDRIPAAVRSEVQDALELHQEMVRHFDVQA